MIRTTDIQKSYGENTAAPDFFPLEVSGDRENPEVDEAENAGDDNGDSFTAESSRKIVRIEAEKDGSKPDHSTARTQLPWFHY